MKTSGYISFWRIPWIGLLCLSILWTACDNTQEDKQEAIDFSAGNSFLENKSTLVDNLSYLGSRFKVYADFNTDEGEIRPLFRGTEVSYLSDGSWYYSPLEYWYTNGDYDFRAVWPASADIVHSLSTGKSINIQNYSVVSEQAYDLMVAYVYRDMVPYDASPVDLVFRHTLAAVNIIVRKEAEDPQVYTLKETFFKNMYVAGNFIYEGNPTTPEALADCWNFSYFHSASCLHQSYDVTVSTTGTTPVHQFIMPQSINEASVSDENKTILGYSLIINGSEVTTEVKLPAITWLPGYIYTYRITLKASGVDIDVITTEWDKVDVTVDDIYGSL